MLSISAQDIDRVADYPAIVDALAAAFRGKFEVPLRHHHQIQIPDRPEATLLLMPAWTSPGKGSRAGNRYIGLKSVTIFPDNPARNEPTVQGMYFLLDGETGRPLALIDGPELTVRRTAAASALAARHLAPRRSTTMLMIGSGAMAPCLIRAHRSVRPVEKVVIWNRNQDGAEELAARMRSENVDAVATSDLEDAARSADLICCATISSEPLVLGQWLKPGTHVDLVGAFRPDLRETDDDVMRRGTVFVDTRAGGLAEAGDIVQAVKSGALSEGDIAGDLFSLTRGEHPGRQADDEITVFKSVGTAIEDLAAAILIYEAAAA